jgi:predicted ATPase
MVSSIRVQLGGGASELSRTQFVGRGDDVPAVVELLATPGVRLLTLAGPGGIGKTRLALAAMERASVRFNDGAAVVALAGVRDPRLLDASLSMALGLRSESGEAAWSW